MSKLEAGHPIGDGTTGVPPFDSGLLDRLMQDRGLDVLLVSSKHNIQYLLGGYRFFMFDYMDATGLSRYLPILVYVRGEPDRTTYIGNPNEGYERDLNRFWPKHLVLKARGSTDAMRHCVDILAASRITAASFGVELGFLPADAFEVLRQGLPHAKITDSVETLEALRAVKTESELADLESASERVVEAMQATFTRIEPGQTKFDVVDILREEESRRGLLFEYCLITAGSSFNRAPSSQILQPGDIISLDSGGNYHGYIGDLCRMGILGGPSEELEDVLGEIERIQQAARAPIRDGANGSEIFAAVTNLMSRQREGRLSFVAHGMGLISHEAPRLLDDGPIPYPASHRAVPLQSGMVLSIETTWQHPRLGFVKLEDTVAVTTDGWQAYGDGARGWNRCGSSG